MDFEEDPAFAPLRKAQPTHTLGQALEDLSVAELGERIELLRAEILRLEQTLSRKQASREQAAAFFKF